MGVSAMLAGQAYDTLHAQQRLPLQEPPSQSRPLHTSGPLHGLNLVCPFQS